MTARAHLAEAFSLTQHVCDENGHRDPLDSACVGCAIAAEIDAALEDLDRWIAPPVREGAAA